MTRQLGASDPRLLIPSFSHLLANREEYTEIAVRETRYFQVLQLENCCSFTISETSDGYALTRCGDGDLVLGRAFWAWLQVRPPIE